MGIIDSHCHIACKGNIKQNLDKLKIEMNQYDINKSIIFIDPFVKEFTCPNESKNDFHYCHVSDILDKQRNLSIICDKCNKQIYYGYDPFFLYNQQLFNQVDDNMFYLFLTLSISNNTMNFMLEQFKELYEDKLRGLKLYTGLSDVTLNNIRKLDSNLPLLIHTGKAYNQDPKNMINFLKNYKGFIILAHYARFCPEIVDLVKHYDNIYIDTSPSAYIFNEYLSGIKKKGLFDYNHINKPEDLYYKALDLFGIDKLIFGSDYPFSNIGDEIQLLNKINLTENEYDKLTNKNIMKILKRSIK